MTAIGSRKRRYIGIWILAALLLVGYNGFTLMSLFNPSLADHSPEPRIAAGKWRQLRERTLKKTAVFDPDLIRKKMMPGLRRQVETARTAPAGNGVNKPKSAGVRLPVVTGIICVSDIQGNKRLLAVIDGRTYRQADRVQGFWIRKITEKGLHLTRSGSQWFAPAPKVHFSVEKTGAGDK